MAMLMKEASFEVSALLNSFSFSLPTENLLQSEALQWVRVLLRLLTSRQFGLLEVFLLFFLVIPFLILVVYISKRNIFKFTSKGKHSGGKTAFLYKHSRFNEKAEARIRDEVGDYQPPWWYSPHLGTLVSFGADRKLQYEVEVMQAEDGGHFTVSWYPHKPSPSEEVMRKIIVFFPGLGLTAKNKITQQFAYSVNQSGFFVAVVGARGLDIPLTNGRPWHPGFLDDAITFMDHISEVYPARFAKVFLSGFSAGTNITQKVILHYGKLRKNYGRQLQIQGAMCVCINYDYVASRDRLESTFIGCVYSMLMCWLVKDILHRNSHVHHELPGGRSAVSRILSRCVYLSHYDQHAALHLHGYKSEESLQHALSMFEVHNIDVPLLALQPQDDPLHLGQVRDNLCVDRVVANPNMLYMETSFGNHFGFYEGSLLEAFSNDSSYTYPARVAVSFFNHILDQQPQGMTLRSKQL